MKQKLIAWTRPLLCACMAFSWWVSCDLPCILFLGEYAYPEKEEK